MYKITLKDKEMISNYLKNVIVPSQVGASLIQIAGLLDGLEEIKEEEPKKK